MNQRALLLFSVSIIILLTSCTHTQNWTPTQSQSGPTRPVPRQLALAEPALTVAPGQYVFYKFTAPDRGRVTGRFRAAGGSGNDIQVLILDSDQFENWRNGHNTSAYYNSQKVTVSNVDAMLREGTYYLVFNNNFSAFSNKAITADIKLTEP